MWRRPPQFHILHTFGEIAASYGEIEAARHGFALALRETEAEILASLWASLEPIQPLFSKELAFLDSIRRNPPYTDISDQIKAL
jgi:hypothetical protein